MRQEEKIERFIFKHGWVGALCAAAVAVAVSSLIASPIAKWACLLARDVSLATGGSILVALGLRRARTSGISFRTLAYPVGGVLIFSFLIGSSVAASSVLQYSITSFGPDVPTELNEHLATVRCAGFIWAGIAVTAGLAGAFTPLRVPAGRLQV
jgi:hypothetical protein